MAEVQQNWSAAIKPPEMSFDDEDKPSGAASTASMPQTKCIWDLCIETVERAEMGQDTGLGLKKPALIFPGALPGDNVNVSRESSLLMVGSKSSGKTSMILRFLDRDEQPKATTALEYTFGRRSKGANLVKDVAHVWELGGGTFLSNLIETPINQQTIKSLSVVVVVDLSKPDTIWSTLETLLSVVKMRVKKVINELKSTCPSEANAIVAECLARYGADHPDKDLLDIIPIPLAIVGSKFDLYQDFDSEKKKVISKSLRFLAHYHGAHLCFFSSKIESLVMKSRGLLGHLVFKTSISKTTTTDHSKAINVLAGMDALSQIGSPSSSLGSRSLLEQWKTTFITSFPQEVAANIPEDPCKDSQYDEPLIDSMRSQKDEELERYKKQQEKKARDEARREGKLIANGK